MQSKTKMWHMSDGVAFGNVVGKCQSYNYDRPNPLYGEAVEKPPENAKVCKKCLTHVK